MASRSRSCLAISFIGGVKREGGGFESRTAECISRAAFHNAPCALQPARHPIGAGFLPSFRHRREPPFFAIALETEPSVAVLVRDRGRSSERATPPLGSSAAVELAGIRTFSGRTRGGTAIDLPSLGGGRRNEPYLPPFSRRIEKRSVTHRRVLRRETCASFRAASFLSTAGAKMPPNNDHFSFDFRKRTCMAASGLHLGLYLVSSFLPTSRWSKLRSVLKTRK